MEASRPVWVALSQDPIEVGPWLEKVRSAECGGIVVFLGEVRATTQTATPDPLVTERLFYEAHEAMALSQMQRIGEEASERFAARVAIVHRLGELMPTDSAVLCIAACPHRAAAFDCCEALIDQIKADVPIWKKEVNPYSQSWVHPIGASQLPAADATGNGTGTT